MTETWTAADDAILEARARGKRVSDSVSWPTEQEEHTCESGSVFELHDPAGHDPEAGVSWGFCATVTTTPGSLEVILESCIGDRVRPGHEAAMDEAIAEANREMAEWMTVAEEWVWPPFEYVRDGDLVFLQSRCVPDELDQGQLSSLNREFERIMINYIPDDLFEEHMYAPHFEDDDDCACDACEEAYEAGTSS